MDTTKYTPTILSLCPGIRGIERGLERIFPAIRVAAYVEIETFIIENLLAAMEAGLVDAAPIWTNLKTFNPEPFRGRIDGIIGGYPCQPFSVAGNRQGAGDPRHLWPYIASSIRTIRPVWCFFENVRGHLTCGYDIVRTELQGMGYKVREGIFSAEEVGAPHRRERLFILAILDYSGSIGSKPEYEIQARRHSAESSGERLGYSKHHGLPATEVVRGGSATSQYVEEGENCAGESERASGRCSVGCLSEELANASSTGLERKRVRARGTPKAYAEPAGSHCGCWPSRPGEQQHDWEEPRTIESGLGSTAHGYNFREDLLRALGNSVVEQTAELAFRDLLNKHNQQ